jgi:hypothetical protein
METAHGFPLCYVWDFKAWERLRYYEVRVECVSGMCQADDVAGYQMPMGAAPAGHDVTLMTDMGVS